MPRDRVPGDYVPGRPSAQVTECPETDCLGRLSAQGDRLPRRPSARVDSVPGKTDCLGTECLVKIEFHQYDGARIVWLRTQARGKQKCILRLTEWWRTHSNILA